MYREHYGLLRTPFEMTPDPAFLYLGETHREGLATLVYGVQSGKGFVMLTGEVGTGKTTLLHALLGQLDADTASAFLFNPKLEPLDFFRILFDDRHLYRPKETVHVKGWVRRYDMREGGDVLPLGDQRPVASAFDRQRDTGDLRGNDR